MPGSRDDADPVGPVTLRAASSRLLHVGLVVAALAWTVATLADGAAGLLPAGPVVVALLVLSWAAFWRAAVVVDDRGVRLLNVVRDVEVPWSALDDAGAHWALTLHAGGREYRSWSATARSQVGERKRARAERRAARLHDGAPRRTVPGADAESALAVVRSGRERWQAGAGPGDVVVRWNAPVLGAALVAVVLVLAAVVL